MFKKIITFFVLLVFLFIGFIHNSMMAFAMSQNISHGLSNHKIKYSNCSNKNTNSKKECNNIVNIDKNLNSYKEFKFLSIKITLFTFSSIFTVNFSEFKNKNLYKIHSPPNYKRKIKFYSYSNLVKIIKSNT